MDGKDDPPPLRPAAAIRKLAWKRLPSQGPLCGVCAGLARHIGWKPNRLRLALVLSSLLLAGVPALLYIYAARAIPADDSR